MSTASFARFHPAVLRPPAMTLLGAIGLGSIAALGVALVAQHVFGIEPCPWCVIQRLVLVGVAVVALAAAFAVSRAPRAAAGVGGVLLLALAVGGGVAAWYQHTVAAKQLSCAFTWADRTLMSLQLDAWLPSVFKVGATCADAAQATLHSTAETTAVVLAQRGHHAHTHVYE